MKVKKGYQPGLGSLLAVVPLLIPFSVLAVIPLAPGASSVHLSPRALVVSRYVLWGITLYMLTASFVMEWAMRRGSERLRSRGYDPDVFVLRANVATASCLPFLGFILCLLGGPSLDAYVLVTISLAFGAFWCWRERRVFILGRKSDNKY